MESIEIDAGEDAVKVRLKAKPSETINREDIEKCLAYTTEKTARP
jgi:hypothetical protein